MDFYSEYSDRNGCNAFVGFVLSLVNRYWSIE